MSHEHNDFGEWSAAIDPQNWTFCGPFGEPGRERSRGDKGSGTGRGPGRGRGRRRRQFFESGEVKYVILRLLKEKPRHGYEVLKAMEQEIGGWYTASPGTVYPTLQLLEDQGYIRMVETEGKKVYYITPEGEAFLAEHGDVLDDILDRVREAVEDLAGGAVAELNEAFSRMAGMAYRQARRDRPGDDRTQKIVEILRRAGKDIEEVLRSS
jgi:DNA-binding PadR family transcriptional regulator